MNTSVFEAVRGGAHRNAIAISTRRKQWTFGDLLASAARCAERLTGDEPPGTLVTARLTDAAATAIVSLAGDLAGLPVLHDDPHTTPGSQGILVSDTAPRLPSVRPNPWWDAGDLPLWLHRTDEPPALGGVPARSQIFRTSGSTGLPASVVRSATSVLVDCDRIASFLRYRIGVAVISVTPAFHSYGFSYGLIAPLLAGAPVHHCTPKSTPAVVARAIRDFGARTVIGLPYQYKLLAERAGGPIDFTTLRTAVSSAAPLPGNVAAAMARNYKFTLYNAYGSSETGAISLAETSATWRAGDVGPVLPGVTVRLDPPDCGSTGGELLLSTDALATGYLSPAGLTPLPVTDEWYRTGDHATLHNNRIQLLGRIGDIINVAGKKVAAAEIERIIAGHPAVIDVQVVATADETRGQVPTARVVLRDGVPVQELINWCRANLSPHQMPRQVKPVPGIPKSATGKPLKSSTTT